MLKSFRHKGLKKFAEDGCTSGIDQQHAKNLRLQLTVLSAATSIDDLRTVPKSWKLHPLKGEHEGTWSLTVKENWRLTFKFDGNDVILLNYEDYH
ncbi:type II toxin-antitoxin system RelE/ParE family toxin [Acinetobacter baumannii]|nr:type II toxin-antitoxin system RelE/ParE family toxin [Acinetobacter baumannii]